jgi:D-arginine dehydrogenase
MDTDVDFAIVGAGIAGASLAWRLAAHGSVRLLEAEDQPGLHSTGRSAAMFMASYGPPQVRALTRASRAFYAAPPAGFTETPLLAPRGALYVAWTGQQECSMPSGTRCRPAAPKCFAWGRPRRWRACRCCARKACSAPSSSPTPWTSTCTRCTRATCAARAARAPGCGAAPHCSTRAAKHGAWRIGLSDGRTLRARVLVNAAGAWADEVAQRAGLAPLGLQPRRRSAFIFDAPAGTDHRHWPTVAGIDESWYFKPDAGQLLGSPANADPVPPHDVQAEELDIATGIARIEAATTLAIRRPRRVWAGLRTFAPDGELVVGFDAHAEGFFWLAGQGGYGIQSAAGVAELAAALPLTCAIGAKPAPATRPSRRRSATCCPFTALTSQPSAWRACSACRSFAGCLPTSWH